MMTSRRSARRIEAVKERARPELSKCGWDSLHLSDPTRFSLPDVVENISRIDAACVSNAEFVRRFEQPRVPVIITGLLSTWPANHKWTLHRLGKKYRNQKMKCGEDDDGYSVKMKMKYYMQYMQETRDDSPLYIFDSSFGERHKTRRLLEDYEVPSYFKDDLFRYADEKKRPPYRWFVMGPARSGTGIHIDPLGTSAWNALISGHKRWCLIPPHAPKALVKPDRTQAGKHPDEAVTWFAQVYPRVKLPDWPAHLRAIEAVQRPGETMFVPCGWWHVVLNMDTTIAVTQNFCSPANLSEVWPRTVRGRPRLSKHWLRRLRRERPELMAIIDNCNKDTTGSMSASSSSDSSSSSSSSSESDEDSGNDLTSNHVTSPRKRKFPPDHCSSTDCANKLRRSRSK